VLRWVHDSAPGNPAAGPGEYLFCFWNCENLFDDQKDSNRPEPDQEYNTWFADNKADRELKYNHLAEALVKMNGGNGPDILCVAEVETLRAAELLREALNAKLPKDATPYGEPVMKEVNAGRHIATAMLTRLPVVRDRTKGYGKLRILQAHITINDKDLVIFASHWTSQLSDKTGSQREKYANEVYGQFHAMYKSNPNVKVLVCGDFNDVPDSTAVREHLHTTNDPSKMTTPDGWPKLLNLMAGKDPDKYGTHYHLKPLIYDQICVSEGLLDKEGWSCEPDSIHTVADGLIAPNARHRQPWRFGNPKDSHSRGYSDHFPVTVKLRVQ
jgi:endonuclease/exonuclease/phosphatase family metal-dependent hydrolase